MPSPPLIVHAHGHPSQQCNGKNMNPARYASCHDPFLHLDNGLVTAFSPAPSQGLTTLQKTHPKRSNFTQSVAMKDTRSGLRAGGQIPSQIFSPQDPPADEMSSTKRTMPSRRKWLSRYPSLMIHATTVASFYDAFAASTFTGGTPRPL